MPRTNYRTPPGWRQLRVHGGLMFVRNDGTARVRKAEDQGWQVEYCVEGGWSFGGYHRRWIDGVRAVDANGKG